MLKPQNFYVSMHLSEIIKYQESPSAALEPQRLDDVMLFENRQLVTAAKFINKSSSLFLLRLLVKYSLCYNLKKCQLPHIIRTRCLVQVDLVQSCYVLKRSQWIFLSGPLTTNHHMHPANLQSQ